MEKMKLLIGRVMFAGVALSASLVLFGGIYYLIINGHNTVNYQIFHPVGLLNNHQTDIKLFPLIWIQAGILVLIATQVIRVALTAWLFLRIKDIYFSIISFFILIILIYALF